MMRLIWTAGFAAIATPAAAAVTLFLVDPSWVATAPIVTSPNPFTESGPASWNGAGLFDGAFSAADINESNAQFGLASATSFKVFTITFDGPGEWTATGSFPQGTVPIWDFNPVSNSGGGTGGGGGTSVGGGGGGSGLGDPGGPGGVANNVPEPSTWVMLLVGSALLGRLAWNRQRVHKLTTSDGGCLSAEAVSTEGT